VPPQRIPDLPGKLCEAGRRAQSLHGRIHDVFPGKSGILCGGTVVTIAMVVQLFNAPSTSSSIFFASPNSIRLFSL
jgi:hypothetical protein